MLPLQPPSPFNLSLAFCAWACCCYEEDFGENDYVYTILIMKFQTKRRHTLARLCRVQRDGSFTKVHNVKWRYMEKPSSFCAYRVKNNFKNISNRNFRKSKARENKFLFRSRDNYFLFRVSELTLTTQISGIKNWNVRACECVQRQIMMKICFEQSFCFVNDFIACCGKCMTYFCMKHLKWYQRPYCTGLNT